jgi:ankyrin repeat protein
VNVKFSTWIIVYGFVFGLLLSVSAACVHAQVVDVWGNAADPSSDDPNMSPPGSPDNVSIEELAEPRNSNVSKVLEERLEGVDNPAAMNLLLGWYGKVASRKPSFFFEAAREGNSRRLDVLLTHNPELVFATDTLGRTGLHWAAVGGHVNEVNKILAFGAVPNAKDNGGKTPMDLALENGHKKIAHLFMRGKLHKQRTNASEATTPPNDQTENLWDRLEETTKPEILDAIVPPQPSEQPSILPEKRVRSIVPEKAPEYVPAESVSSDLSLKPLEVPVEGMDPPPDKAFRKAVIAGDSKKVESLLQRHPGLVHSRDTKLGWTPLHWAVERQHYDVVQLLLFRGADVNAREIHGWTPLRLARKGGNRRIFNLLLNYRATE